MAPRVALVSGQWGQNIGNAFFNLGGRYVLERVFGAHEVQFIQDQPGYRTLHNKLRGNPRNFLQPILHLDIDYLVLQGPILNSWMRINWEDTFRVLRKRDVKILLLSCAFFRFNEPEFAAVRSFLQEYPPDLIATRDGRSYDILNEWLPTVPKTSGIDSAFFVSDFFEPFTTTGEPYIVLNFDRYPEPTLSMEPSEGSRSHQMELAVGNRRWYLRTPRFLNWASHRSKVWAYLGDATDRRRLPASFDGYDVFRTEHRSVPYMTYKIYRQPNATASDEPWTYLNIYANSTFTLSDRVHACVAALAFGRPAMLFTPSPRASLFERVGAKKIRERLASLDMDQLIEDKADLLRWLRTAV